jgi:hypothetical protein
MGSYSGHGKTMKNYTVTIYDPHTQANRLFWVTLLTAEVNASSEEHAILQALIHFCSQQDISLKDFERLHITANVSGSTETILIKEPGNA